MTATNHALTGAAIGLIIGQPLLAMPLALASHFVCDAIPHFGFANPRKAIKSNTFRNYLIAETFICAAIVAALAWLHPVNWQLAAVCAFIAASPDLLSINRYLSEIRGRQWRPSAYAKFAHGIQWFEKPIGAVVEVAWLIAIIVLVTPLIIK